MKRRDLLKGLLGASVIVVAGDCFADKSTKRLAESLSEAQRQKSVGWLVDRINEACNVVGESNKAFEYYDGNIYIHTTYAVGTTGNDDLVSAMWGDIRDVISHSHNKNVIWRKYPEIRKDGDKTILSMRLSIGPRGPNDHVYSRFLKHEGAGAVYL